MKIHEQEWKAQGNGVVAVSDAVVIKVEVAPWRMARGPGADEWKVAAEVSQQVTNTVEAAPKMARALLAQGETSTEGAWHTHACWKTKRAMCLPECIEAWDALCSAGVL